jgi:hypothetical protein
MGYSFSVKSCRHKKPVPENIKNKIVELYRKCRISVSYISKMLCTEGLTEMTRSTSHQKGWICLKQT